MNTSTVPSHYERSLDRSKREFVTMSMFLLNTSEIISSAIWGIENMFLYNLNRLIRYNRFSGIHNHFHWLSKQYSLIVLFAVPRDQPTMLNFINPSRLNFLSHLQVWTGPGPHESPYLSAICRACYVLQSNLPHSPSTAFFSDLIHYTFWQTDDATYMTNSRQCMPTLSV